MKTSSKPPYSVQAGVTGRVERQPLLFEDDIPTNGKARKGLWINPAECPHLEWDDTTTVWPGETFERNTYTCVNCGTVRGRLW